MGKEKSLVLHIFFLLSVFNGVYLASILRGQNGLDMGTKEQTTTAYPDEPVYKRYKFDPSSPIPRTTTFRAKTALPSTVNINVHSDLPQSIRTHTDTDVSTADSEVSSEVFESEQFPLAASLCNVESHNEETNESIISVSVNIPPQSESDLDTMSNISSSSNSLESDFELSSEYSSFDEQDSQAQEETQDISESVGLSEEEEIYMAGMALSSRHNLTKEAAQDLFKLLGIITHNNTGEYSLKSSKSKASENKIYDVCSKCFTIFPGDEVECSIEGCNELRFKGSRGQQHKRQRKCFFVVADVKSQIKSILEKDGVWHSMIEYKNKLCHESEQTLDLLSGEVYKKLSSELAFLNTENSVSFVFNTDGVALYSSSKVNIWPVYLVINELPPKMRFSRQNMVLWGVWQSKGKPCFRAFLEPFIHDMKEIKEHGVQVNIDKQTRNVKGVVVAGTLDLQAKAVVCEMTQHNGENGCLTCEEKGEVVKQGKGHTRVFPFRADDPVNRKSEVTGVQGVEKADTAANTGYNSERPIIDYGGLNPDIIKSDPGNPEENLNSNPVDALAKVVQSALLPGPQIVSDNKQGINADMDNVDKATGVAAGPSVADKATSVQDVPATNIGAQASDSYMTPTQNYISETGTAAPAMGIGMAPAQNYISGTGTAAPAIGSGMAPAQNYISGTGTAAPAMGSGMAPAQNYISGTGTAAPAMGSGVAPTEKYIQGPDTAAPAMGSGMALAQYYVPGKETAAPTMGSGMAPTQDNIPGPDTAAPALGSGVAPTEKYIQGPDTAAPAMGSGMAPAQYYVPGKETAAPTMGIGMAPAQNYVPGKGTAAPAMGSGVGPTPDYVPETGAAAAGVGSGMAPTQNYIPGTDTAAPAMGSGMAPAQNLVPANPIVPTVNYVPAASGNTSPTDLTETTGTVEATAVEKETSFVTTSVTDKFIDLKDNKNEAWEDKDENVVESVSVESVDETEKQGDDDFYDQDWWEKDYDDVYEDDDDDYYEDDEDGKWFDDEEEDDDEDDSKGDDDIDDGYWETSTTTKSWSDTSTTADEYDQELQEDDTDYDDEKDDSVDAGTDLMTSGHHFDNSFGAFAGAKVSSKGKGVHDGFAYTWTLLLTICIVLVGLFIFWNRHKVEKYIVSLRQPAPSNQNRPVLSRDEEKNLLDNEYA